MIYAVANHKGGVGKTHTVFHLAGALSEQGRRVLAVDLDPQGNLTGLLQQKPTVRGIYDVLVDSVPAQQSICATNLKRLHLLPSCERLERLDAVLQNAPDAQIRLAESFRELQASRNKRFDVVLIDCPPSLGLATRNALATADRVIIPVEADKFSLDGLNKIDQLIQGMRRVTNPHLKIAGILVSLFNGRRKIEQLYLEALKSRGIPIFESVVKDAASYREAVTAKMPITHYKPRSEFADTFRQFAKELTECHAKA